MVRRKGERAERRPNTMQNKLTRSGRWIFAATLIALTSGCATMTTQGSETEIAICEGIGGALPTRSRDDTQTTINEITMLYATFAAVCEAQQEMIP
jgi:hypothetical protein